MLIFKPILKWRSNVHRAIFEEERRTLASVWT